MSSAEVPLSQTDMGWGPDAGPWSYHKLSGEALSNELERLAFARTSNKTDIVSMQPCPNPEKSSQDRYLVLRWDLPGGQWEFNGVFDGHAGHETVDYLIQALPPVLRELLTTAVTYVGGLTPHKDVVSNLLVKAISQVDDQIKSDIESLFPGGPDAIANLPDEEINDIVNDLRTGGLNNAKILRGMRGSTALVSLVDPAQQNLWVASLGDCQAVLGSKEPSGKWKVSLLSHNHNGRDEQEVKRTREEHPGEEECIVKDRILGAIAVTRAIGDYEFKLPTIWTDRILKKTHPGFSLSTNMDEWLPRNISPPYLSNIAEVRHVTLDPSAKDSQILVVCSDGLIDLYMYESGKDELSTVEAIAEHIIPVVAAHTTGNKALSLLRHALGGDNEEQVSRMLTVEMTDRWMDDVTILVHSF